MDFKTSFTPDFWNNIKQDVPESLKEFVIDQYLDTDSLYIYCDASASIKNPQHLTAACACIANSKIFVRSQIINAIKTSYKNPYGELKAVYFALSIFNGLISRHHHNVIIYTDLREINDVLNGKRCFKDKPLMDLQDNLLTHYQSKIQRHTNLNISIKHLNKEQKKFNPFHNAAHNAALKLLREIRK